MTAIFTQLPLHDATLFAVNSRHGRTELLFELPRKTVGCLSMSDVKFLCFTPFLSGNIIFEARIGEGLTLDQLMTEACGDLQLFIGEYFGRQAPPLYALLLDSSYGANGICLFDGPYTLTT